MEKEHCYLGYQDVEVHFIYGFLWRATEPLNLNVFSSGLGVGREKANGWISPYIHERLIGTGHKEAKDRPWFCSYQPTFVLERRCLEFSDSLNDKSPWLVVPMKAGAKLPRKGQDPEFARSKDTVSFPVSVSWTVRVFNFGCGIVTVRVSLRDLAQIEPKARFSRIHWALRLAPNLDVSAESHWGDVPGIGQELPITDSFLFTPALGSFRLFELVKRRRDEALARIPLLSTGNDCAPKIYCDNSGFAHQYAKGGEGKPSSRNAQHLSYRPREWYEDQAPFTFCAGVLDEEGFLRLNEDSSGTAREVSSIAARLTLDNRAQEDFLHMTNDYITQALGFSRQYTLRNRSHDKRLFFTFSRRGAIALTARPGDLPALFVVPSLLNLFELIRARLLGGIVVGSRLAKMAEALARLDPLVGESPDAVEYARLRTLVVQNLQNPLEYLFDGGSVTDLAIEAEEALFARDAWRNVRRSFDVVDRLMAAWDDEVFRLRYGS